MMATKQVTFESPPPFVHVEGTGFVPGTFKTGKGSWMAVSYIEAEDTISISNVNSEEKGDMKRMIEAAIKKFGTNKILFYNVMSNQLADRIQGFTKEIIIDPLHKEAVVCFRGVWN